MIKGSFVFSPDNLMDNISKLGAWSAYGLASIALQYYFPSEYDEDGYCHAPREVELVNQLSCESWSDVIIKYQNEVGYDAPDGFDPAFVNER